METTQQMKGRASNPEPKGRLFVLLEHLYIPGNNDPSATDMCYAMFNSEEEALDRMKKLRTESPSATQPGDIVCPAAYEVQMISPRTGHPLSCKGYHYMRKNGTTRTLWIQEFGTVRRGEANQSFREENLVTSLESHIRPLDTEQPRKTRELRKYMSLCTILHTPIQA